MSKGFPAGKLDRRITILRSVNGQSGRMGEVAKAWQDHATVWAAVNPVSDGERWRSMQGQVAATATHRFVIRWGIGVTPLDRLRYDGSEYEITATKEIDRKVGQEITAVARADRPGDGS